VLLLNASYYAPFWTDDAYITLRYAWRIWHEGEAAFNPGERLEGLTNLGWALLLAPFSDGDALEAGRILGRLCGVGTVLLLADWCRRQGLGLVAMGAALAALVLPAWAPSWTMLGLETAGVMFLVTLAWTRHGVDTDRGRGLPWAALGLGLGPWLRPDAALVTLIVGVWHFIRRGTSPRLSRTAMVAAGFVFASAGALVALKLHWFGEILPNPFHMKAASGDGRGAWYLAHLATVPDPALPALLAVGVLASSSAAFMRQDRGLPAIIAIAWLLMCRLVGGDFMANYRMVVPAWPALCACLAVLIGDLSQAAQSRGGDRGRWAVQAGLLLLLAAAVAGPARVWTVERQDHASNGDPEPILWKPGFPPWHIPDWDMGLRPSAPFAAAWPLVHAGPGVTVAYTDIGLIGWTNPTTDVVDLLALTDAVMAGRNGETGADKWAYLQGRVDIMILDMNGGAWARFRDRLGDGGWSVIDGCGAILVLQNPSRSTTPEPDAATLQGRLDWLLRGSPGQLGLHATVGRMLARDGVDLGIQGQFVDDVAKLRGPAADRELRDLRCDMGLTEDCAAPLPGCSRQEPWTDLEALSDPATWPPAMF
jgi:hypothetical protein